MTGNEQDDGVLFRRIEELEYPYRDKQILKELYIDREWTQKEIADRFGVSSGTINNWLLKNGLSDHAPDRKEYEIPPNPIDDADFLIHLYEDEGLSTKQIGALIDAAATTVRERLLDAGVDIRGLSQAQTAVYGNRYRVPYEIDKWGTPTWKISEHRVQVHRLLAVSMWGLDAIRDKEVHHVSGIRWDNRPDNLELLDTLEHYARHEKLNWLDKLRIAELYENGNTSYRDLSEQFPVSSGTVRRAHKEVLEAGAQ